MIGPTDRSMRSLTTIAGHYLNMCDVRWRTTDGVRAQSKLAADRTLLAYDRTMLSWIRTAIALITFGFSIHQFSRLESKGTLVGYGFIGPHEFGMSMIVVGLLALLLATLEHRAAIQALKARYLGTELRANAHRSLAGVLAALVSILGLLALLSTLAR